MKRSKSAASGKAAKSAPSRRPGKTENGQTNPPKSTRPEPAVRRDPPPPVPTGDTMRPARTFDAMPDRIDARDWFYSPRLAPLPDQLVNCDAVGEDGILDQGAQGACTGYALAGVINFLLRARNLSRRVSPRMLYEMARRYDEWPGEAYEGSSARGAMKGWVAHGVCDEAAWPAKRKGMQHLTPDLERQSRGTPGGAFYRVMHREVRDMHAALTEVGVLYLTLMVHAGWDTPVARDAPLVYIENGNLRERPMPTIKRRGRADSGHAVAIVGYTRDGFIVQNSWGRSWGAGGFALLPYEDYLMHATDVWVAQLGVPVELDLWSGRGAADSTAGLARAMDAVPLEAIRPFVIDVANDGRLSDRGHYWTSEADVDRLFAETIPAASATWAKRRVMLYLHGGLNDEIASAKRVVAFKEPLLANEIYPLHLMWETGAMESIKGILDDFLGLDNRLAGGVADWLRKARDGLIEAKDRTFELTVAGAGSALWDQMKQNAARASDPSFTAGVTSVVARAVAKALTGASRAEKDRWELHVVAHSAGSIFLAHAMGQLTNLGVPLKSVQLLAPAITVDRFKRLMLPFIDAGDCPRPTAYVLSDTGERDDDVGPYGKSLLYLVSNAFEARRGTPLLGMERYLRPIRDSAGRVSNGGALDADVAALFAGQTNGRPSLVVAGEDEASPNLSRSNSHGGFDNDEWTMNSVLFRILGNAPKRPFTMRDLQY